MTEEEAKTKACCGPFRDAVPYAGAAEQAEIAKSGLDPDYSAEVAGRYPCIASACMAWRWSMISNPDQSVTAPPHVISTTDGNCGLAGQSNA